MKASGILLILIITLNIVCVYPYLHSVDDDSEYPNTDIMNERDDNKKKAKTVKNVNGTGLEKCNLNGDLETGIYRDGYCETNATDGGVHTICAKMNNKWLKFNKEHGNDLTPPQHPTVGGFPGLIAGNYWCVCAIRWRNAIQAGHVAEVYLPATNKAVLGTIYKDDDVAKQNLFKSCDKESRVGGVCPSYSG